MNSNTTRLQLTLWLTLFILLLDIALPSYGLPGIRLAVSSEVENVLVLILNSLPFVLIINSFFIQSKQARLVNLILAGILALPSSLSAYWILRHGLGDSMKWGYAIPTELVTEATASKSTIRVYRVSNGGGTGAQFFVRQERAFPCRILLVRNLRPSISGEFKIDIKILDSETVELQNVYYREMKYQPKYWLSTVKARPSWIFGKLVAAN